MENRRCSSSRDTSEALRQHVQSIIEMGDISVMKAEELALRRNHHDALADMLMEAQKPHEVTRYIVQGDFVAQQHVDQQVNAKYAALPDNNICK